MRQARKHGRGCRGEKDPQEEGRGVLGIEGPDHFREERRGHSSLWVSGFPHYVVNVEPKTRWGTQGGQYPWVEQSRARDRLRRVACR